VVVDVVVGGGSVVVVVVVVLVVVGAAAAPPAASTPPMLVPGVRWTGPEVNANADAVAMRETTATTERPLASLCRRARSRPRR
jgi:hypothetical protein